MFSLLWPCSLLPGTFQQRKSLPGRSHPTSGPISRGGGDVKLSAAESLSGAVDSIPLLAATVTPVAFWASGRPLAARRRSMIARPLGGAVRFKPTRANSLGVAVSSLPTIRTPTLVGADAVAQANFATTSNCVERKGSRCSALPPAAALRVVVSFSVSPSLPLRRRDSSSGTGRYNEMQRISLF